MPNVTFTKIRSPRQWLIDYIFDTDDIYYLQTLFIALIMETKEAVINDLFHIEMINENYEPPQSSNGY